MNKVGDFLHSLPADYLDAKRALGEQLGATESLLHVHVGLLIFVITALLLRRRMASVWPVAVVALLAVLNEVVDYFAPETWSAGGSLLDLLNTIFWPVVLFLLARRGAGVGTRV